MSDTRSPEEVARARASMGQIVRGLERAPEPEPVEEARERVRAKIVKPARAKALRATLQADASDPMLPAAVRAEAQRLLDLLPQD